MSDSSQFLQLPRTPPISLRVRVLNAVCHRCGNSTYGQGVVRALWNDFRHSSGMSAFAVCSGLFGTHLPLLHMPDCSFARHTLVKL